MGGKTSAASINKYQKKVYDRLTILVPKGTKDIWKDEAEKRNKSMTQFVVDCVNKEIKK